MIFLRVLMDRVLREISEKIVGPIIHCSPDLTREIIKN